MESTRCFIAVELCAKAVARLEKVQEEIRKTGVNASFPSPSQMHLTLAFYPGLNNGEVEEKIVLLRYALQSSRQFVMRVQGIGFLPSEKFIKVVYAGIESRELTELQAHIAKTLEYREDRRFFSHATLARVKDVQNLSDLHYLSKKYVGVVFGECSVEKVFFKKSTLAPHGPVYENLAEFTLQ